ncbi:hypothetical protein ACIOG8_09850 [Streptomyces erythrochromogenes]|uniref:hypothetical protein n=1 Tax=Streptomyces erythrochromogenes TaxID=285574 RepID=UPI003812A287
MVTSVITPAVLARVSGIGPYFAVTTGARPVGGGFRPLAELYGDSDVLAECLRVVSGRLGTDQPRVAASTLHLGTASRLWSIALACAALTGRVPDLSTDRLWWRLPASGPLDLWLPDPREVDQEPLPALHHTVAVRNLARVPQLAGTPCSEGPSRTMRTAGPEVVPHRETHPMQPAPQIPTADANSRPQ